MKIQNNIYHAVGIQNNIYHAVGRQAGMVSRGHVMEELVGITKTCGFFF